jgi:superfamily II RNA helicase
MAAPYAKAGSKAVQYGGKFALNAYKRVTNFFSAARTTKLAMETKNVVKLSQEAAPIAQKITKTAEMTNITSPLKRYITTLSEVDFKRHMKYCKRHGTGKTILLENGRLRYYRKFEEARFAGEMKGRQYVHEFNTLNGNSRGWHETLDQHNKVRQIRPQINNSSKTHYLFDVNGNLEKIW